MSLNFCADQLLLQLVEPSRIVSLSFLSLTSGKPYISAESAHLPVNYGTLEEVLAAKPDLVLACRMLKASYCAYDVSTRTYDAATHSARMDRCESRAELQMSPALDLITTPSAFAYLTPSATNAFLVMQTRRDEIIISFRGTVGLGAGLTGYLDWLNNFQSTRYSDELLGNVHFGFSAPKGMDRTALRQYAPAITRAVNDLVTSMAGSISAEHGIGIEKLDELQDYRSKIELDTMRTIKRALDPKNIMNPGKIFAL